MRYRLSRIRPANVNELRLSRVYKANRGLMGKLASLPGHMVSAYESHSSGAPTYSEREPWALPELPGSSRQISPDFVELKAFEGRASSALTLGHSRSDYCL